MDQSVPRFRAVCVVLLKWNGDVEGSDGNIRLTPLTKDELLVVKPVVQSVKKRKSAVKVAIIILKGKDFACCRGYRQLNEEAMNNFAA